MARSGWCGQLGRPACDRCRWEGCGCVCHGATETKGSQGTDENLEEATA